MNERGVYNGLLTRFARPVALVVQAAARSHLLQFFPPFVQLLWIVRIEFRGTLGMYIFQIAFPAHVPITKLSRPKFSHYNGHFMLPFCA